MASVQVLYSPKDVNATSLSCQFGYRKFSLPPNKPVYIDEADWTMIKVSSRFQPYFETKELSLYSEFLKKAKPVKEEVITPSAAELPKPVESADKPIKPERIPPRKDE